ncbi:glycosyltransferase family 2 protein [Endozoicomonas elysicola]|uniref:glycosyltransferase family 2 protein n=1 Tax=Endozoicomonas elysicola TaxID=305900 RepID=UPI00035C8140|nr:glycosyltransferase family 2 protein [Endozoicomonas elysicola]
MKEMNKISIVTVCYNNVSLIEQCVQSVVNQQYPYIEYIVVDGASTDGTLDIIKKYSDKISVLISEEDNGISDAINKGISNCTGDYVLFVNSDDWLQPDVISKIFENSVYYDDLLYGDMQYWKGDNKDYLFKPDHKNLIKEMTINGGASFFKLTTLKELGGFDFSYSYAMDYEISLRFYTHKKKFLYLPYCIANMRYGGVSDVYAFRALDEVFKAKVKHKITSSSAGKLYLYYQKARMLVRIFLEKLGLSFFVELYRSRFSILKKEL